MASNRAMHGSPEILGSGGLVQDASFSISNFDRHDWTIGPPPFAGDDEPRQIVLPKTSKRTVRRPPGILSLMPRPLHDAPAPSALATGLLRYLRMRGRDPRALAERVGLTIEDEQEDEARIPASALSELIEATADEVGEPFLGLTLPTVLPRKRYGFAEVAIQSCATAAEALECVARYAPLLHPDIEARLERDGAEARFVVETPRKARGANRHVHEYVLAFAVTQLRIGGCEPGVVRVWFAHARPPHLGPLQDFFRTPNLAFGEKNHGLLFDAGTLTAVMGGRDPRMLATVEALADQSLRAQPRGRSFAGLVEGRLEELLPDRGTLEAAGKAMHMSPRTVQRRLEQEGTGFSETLDRVRERLARAWLGDSGRSLIDVGAALGFSDLASFSRAFKRWTGKPPGTWRQAR
jgi:AraC-like DNA-binding protein